MLGTKRAKKFFQIHTNSACKNFEKIDVKKCEKTFFYIHTNIVTKNGEGKKAQNNFSGNTRIVRAKNVGEKRRKEVRKTFIIFIRIS